jgi:hypothetical protein
MKAIITFALLVFFVSIVYFGLEGLSWLDIVIYAFIVFMATVAGGLVIYAAALALSLRSRDDQDDESSLDGQEGEDTTTG